MYKLIISVSDKGYEDKGLVNLFNNIAIPFDSANSDYAQFKKAISEETAQLQDAEGTLMTAQAAKDFIKELP
jgi:hypothetical protein